MERSHAAAPAPRARSHPAPGPRLDGVPLSPRQANPLRGWGRSLAGLALGLSCLGLALRDLDWRTLARLIRDLDPWYLVGLNLLLALSLGLRVVRWRLLLPRQPQTPWPPLASAMVVGYAANNLLPARLGEVVRAWAGARLAGLPLGTVAASMVAERVLDGPVMLAFFFLVLPWLDPAARAGAFSAAYFRAAALSLLLVYLLLLALLAALLAWGERVSGPLVRLAGRLGPRPAHGLRRGLDSFLAGLHFLGGPRRLLGLLLLSVALRVPLFAMHWMFLPAVGLPLDLMMAAMATVGAGLASTLPSGPGYIGTYQLAVFWGLRLCGAPKQPALAYALLYWSGQYFPLVVAGLVEAWRQGFAIQNPWRRPPAASPDPQP